MKPKNIMDSNKLIEPLIYRKYVPMSPPDAKRVYSPAHLRNMYILRLPPPRWYYIDAPSIQLICFIRNDGEKHECNRMQSNANPELNTT